MPETTQDGLTAAETEDLRLLAGAMVPASTEFDVPGADDPVIFADILRSLGRDTALVRGAIARLRGLAGGALSALDQDGLEKILARLQWEGTPAAIALGRSVLQCYYRDDRVMIALGLEARAPFPKGNVLEQGDWSLLEPVKARAPMWRDVP